MNFYDCFVRDKESENVANSRVSAGVYIFAGALISISCILFLVSKAV